MAAINRGRSISDLRLSLYTDLTAGGDIIVSPTGIITNSTAADELDRSQSARLSKLLTLKPNVGKTVQSGNPFDYAFQFGSKLTRGPIGKESLEAVYGSSDDFLKAYQTFEENFFKELAAQKGGREDINVLKASRTIDLTAITNDSKRQMLKDDFTRNVLKLYDPKGTVSLFDVAGAPGMAFPSSNSYTDAFFRYIVDQRGDLTSGPGAYHPAQVLLNSLNFTYKRGKAPSDALSVSSRLPTISALKSAMGDAADGIAGDLSSLGRSLVFDVETTGISTDSVVRSISVSEMIVDPDGSKRMNTLINVAFDSEEMKYLRDIGVGSVADRTMLGRLGVDEGTQVLEPGPGGRNVVKKLTEVLELMTDSKYASISAHNAPFDIKKILDTIRTQEAYDEVAEDVVRAFTQRIEDNPGYVRDTLHNARIYMLDQAYQAIESVMMDPSKSMDDRNMSYIRALFGEENFPMLGTKRGATYAGVENIAIHTNLFELIAEEDGGKGKQVLEKLYKGTHIAETDTILQGYIDMYMKQGSLAIWPLTQQQGQRGTDFGRMMREIVMTSTAVTPVTNVDDFGRISTGLAQRMLSNIQDTAIDALMGTQIRIIGTDRQIAKQLADLGLDPSQKKGGVLSVDYDGKIRFKSITGQIGEDLKIASEPLNDQEAGLRFVQQTLRNSQRNIPIDKNLARRSIISLGVNLLNNQAIEDMDLAIQSAGSATTRKVIGLQDLEEGLTTLYKNIGLRSNIPNASDSLASGTKPPPVFTGSMGKYGVKEVAEMSQALRRIGDPLYFVDPQSRMISSILSGATSGAKAAAFQQVGDVAKDSALRMLEPIRLGVTEGLGLVYQTGVEESYTRIFSSGKDLTKVPIMSTDLLNFFAERAGIDKTRVQRSIGKLSLAPYDNERFVNVKTMFGVGEGLPGMTTDDAYKISEQIVEVFSMDDRGFNRALTDMGYTFDEITSAGRKYANDPTLTANEIAIRTLSEQRQAMGAMMDATKMADSELAQELGDLISRGGLITERLGKTDVYDTVVEALETMGIDTFNDEDLPYMLRMINVEGQQGKQLGAISAVINVEAISKSGENAVSLVNQALDEAEDSYGKIARSLNARGNRAERQQMLDNVSQASGHSRRAVVADFVKRNADIASRYIKEYVPGGPKGLLALGGIAGVALLGYNATKPTVYDETIDMQPYEGTNYTRADNDSLSYLGPMPSSRRDPLYTAGVVGNLDRNKINHTRMGNNKYDHLF